VTPPAKAPPLWRRLPRAWLCLAPRERLALMAVVGLFLLGLTARWLYLRAERPDPEPASAAASPRR